MSRNPSIRQERQWALGLLLLAFITFFIGSFFGRGPQKSAAPPVPWTWRAFGRARLKPTGAPGQWVWPGVGRVSLSAPWQAHVEKTVARFAPPQAAVLIQELPSGRMLAAAGFGPGGAPGAQAFQHPVLGRRLVAASIMKVPTAAALLENNIATIHTASRCNGRYTVSGGSVENHGWGDYGQLTLARALAKSCNTVFARYAQQVGWPPILAARTRLGWREPAWGVPATEKPVVPASLKGLELSQASAGFGHVLVTPWHMLSLTSVLGGGGAPKPPVWIKTTQPLAERTGCGAPCQPHPPQALNKAVAANLLLALRDGVHDPIGTAHKGFFTPGGRYRLPDIYEVHAKTGSLNSPDPKGYLTWFVGVVTKNGQPHLGVVSMVLNEPVWRIRAAGLAGELLSSAPW